MREMTNLGVVTCFPVLLGALTGREDAATLGDEGASQNITIGSNPVGAAYKLTRGGEVIGAFSATNGVCKVVETDRDITVNGSGSGLSGMTAIHIAIVGSELVGPIAHLLPNNVYPAKVAVTIDPD